MDASSSASQVQSESLPLTDTCGDPSLSPHGKQHMSAVINSIPAITVIPWDRFPDRSERAVETNVSGFPDRSEVVVGMSVSGSDWSSCHEGYLASDACVSQGGSMSSLTSRDTVAASDLTLTDSEYMDGEHGDDGTFWASVETKLRYYQASSERKPTPSVKPRSWTSTVEELEASRRPRSYSQRYDLFSSNIGEILELRRKTMSDIMSITSSVQGLEASDRSACSSPSRRRRVAVRSNHVHKKNSVSHQRRITVATCCETLPSQIHLSQLALRPQDHALGVLSATIVPSRRLSVALGRKISSTQPPKRPTRRCSEPFLLDPLTLQNNKWNRKISANSKGHGRRKLSAAAAFPTSTKQKLRELAKDELLASLNEPLIAGAEVVHSPEEEKPVDEVVETGSKEKAERDRLEQKRMRVLNEILETEKNYISCLETLNLVFKNQLSSIGILTEKELHSLFPSYLDEIKESHSWFMLELEERIHNDNWKGIIGDIFAKMTSSYKANLLGIYTNYVNAFPNSISTLSKCTRSSQKFRKFLEDCYENPLVERLDLPSFLLSPVQRLPRYVLLLRELLKYTKDEHPDHYFVEDAMGKMQALISSLNGSIQNSMDFYTASDEKRRLMSRQFTKRSRKKRSLSGRGTFRKKLSLQRDEVKPVPDADQGYCSFSEAKRESPDGIPSPGPGVPGEPGVYERPGQRSFSLSAAEPKVSPGVVLRRRKEAGSTSALVRCTENRKSWRRSIGAALSSLWSTKEEKTNQLSGSYLSIDGTDCTNNEQFSSTVDHQVPVASEESSRRLSTVRRKNAIPSPADPSLPRFAFSETGAYSAAATGDTRGELSPRELTVPSVMSNSSSSPQIGISDSHRVEGSHGCDDDVDGQRRVSTLSRMSSFSTPSSPVSHQRIRERTSTRSIFGRKMQRNLSWQDVHKDDDVKPTGGETSPTSSRRRLGSTRLSFRRLKFRGQSHESLKIVDDDHSKGDVKQEDAPFLVQVKNSQSMSSMDAETHKASPSSSMSEDDVVDGQSVSGSSATTNTNGSTYISNNNNASDIKPAKERRKKFMRSLRNLVRKK